MEKSARELFGDIDSLVKSTQRVRDLAEVFTPYNTIEDMLDLLPADTWGAFPQRTFLEPACGNGNFLVVIFFRKAHAVHEAWKVGELPAGKTSEAYVFHLLAALSSVYGVDISEDNIRGHLDDSHDGAHFRMEMFFEHWLGRENLTGEIYAQSMACAKWIIESNVLVGNMLDVDTDGKPTNNRQLPFVEYFWNPADLEVSVRLDTLGNILESSNSDPNSLWTDYIEPTEFWAGNFLKLETVDKPKWKPIGIHVHERG